MRWASTKFSASETPILTKFNFNKTFYQQESQNLQNKKQRVTKKDDMMTIWDSSKAHIWDIWDRTHNCFDNWEKS